jgi:hypothetical protein
MLKSWWTAAAAAAVLSVAALVAVSDSPADQEGEMLILTGRGSDHRDGPLHFLLEGTPVRGLYPGAVKQMRITVDNPLGFQLSVQRLSAEVTATSRRGCPATSANLQVRDYTGTLPVTVAAAGRTELGGAIPITMPLGATEKCAGVRFTISVSGVGRRVAR